jgi:short-subunit dehydrogenase
VIYRSVTGAFLAGPSFNQLKRRVRRRPDRPLNENAASAMQLNGCSALVTGASAGIGREFACILAKRARCLVLVARREDRLIELCQQLSRANPALTLHVRSADLADPAQVELLLQWLKQEKIEIDVLINNAGLGDLGPFATSDPGRIARILQVNIIALTTLTHALLPDMIRRRRGGILNVSSSAGFLPIADFSVYAASKAYVNSFSEGLRAELRGSGVVVTALCPGPVHTEFTATAQRPGEPPYMSGPELVYVSPATVAQAGLNALAHDRPLVIPGLLMKIGMAIVRALPLLFLRRAARFSAKRRS